MRFSINIPGYGEINPPPNAVDPNEVNANNIIQFGIAILFFLGLVLSLIFLLWGGIRWITSSGDKTKLESARKTIVFAIIGLILVILSFIIVNFLGEIFQIPFFINLGKPLIPPPCDAPPC